MRLIAATSPRPWLALRPFWWSVALVGGALLLVFGPDRAPASAPVQHLYYLPIFFAGVRFERRGGVLAALSAVALYHLANPPLLTFLYGEADLVQIALFLAVGVVTARLTLDGNRLRHLAMTDDLTGLHNLRSFEGHLAGMVRASREAGVLLFMLVLDVDRLKSINDRYGHLAGAEAVRTVGHIISVRLPPNSVACRYGGDEFAITVAGSTPLLAERVAEDLCQAVRDVAPVLAGRQFPAGTLSISVGVARAAFDGRPQTTASAGGDVDIGESLFKAADAALYQAKANGRNRVAV